MSIGITVEVIGSVPELKPQQAQRDASARAGRLGQRAAALYFTKHTDEGETLRQLRYRSSASFIEWYDRAPQALWIEEGTGLEGPLHHWIEPVNARFMAWEGADGNMIFARRVRGISPDPWLGPAIEDNADVMIGFYAEEVEHRWNTA